METLKRTDWATFPLGPLAFSDSNMCTVIASRIYWIPIVGVPLVDAFSSRRLLWFEFEFRTSNSQPKRKTHEEREHWLHETWHTVFGGLNSRAYRTSPIGSLKSTTKNLDWQIFPSAATTPFANHPTFCLFMRKDCPFNPEIFATMGDKSCRCKSN